MNSLKRLWYKLSPLNYQCKAKSYLGQRQENQDNYLIIAPDGQAHYLKAGEREFAQVSAWPNYMYRIAIADGMGGHLFGREIAEELMGSLLALPAQTAFDPAPLREAIYTLHQQLLSRYQSVESARKPGATLVMAEIDIRDGRTLLVHVGDSRAYLQAAATDTLQKITWDHHTAEFDWREASSQAANLAPIDEQIPYKLAQAMGFGSYGIVQQAGQRLRQLSPHLRLDLADELNPNAQSHADIQCFYLKRGDLLLFATDGLWSGEPHQAIPPFTEEGLDDYLRQLAEHAQQTNSQDNITLVTFLLY
jgi:serine/threonine protein phosphatase PrpC